jgi:hypothetical protein
LIFCNWNYVQSILLSILTCALRTSIICNVDGMLNVKCPKAQFWKKICPWTLTLVVDLLWLEVYLVHFVMIFHMHWGVMGYVIMFKSCVYSVKWKVFVMVYLMSNTQKPNYKEINCSRCEKWVKNKLLQMLFHYIYKFKKSFLSRTCFVITIIIFWTI